MGEGDVDPDRLLELVAELIGVLEIGEFRRALLVGLRRAVPCDWISLNDLGPTPEETVVLIDPEFPQEAHAVFARHADENPLLRRYLGTQDGRAYRFSDVTTPGALRATALYREFYASIGLEHQIAFTLPHTSSRVLALALSRRRDDFSDEERDLLNRARPFLIQAFRNAIEHSTVRTELEHRRRGPQLPTDDPGLAAELTRRGVTPRESEVLGALAAGLSDRAIAELLRVSERTVQKHLQRCYRKLQVGSRREAAALAWSLAAGPTRIAVRG